MGARNRNFYNGLTKRMEYEEAAVKIQDLYLDGKRPEAIAAVLDEMVDRTTASPWLQVQAATCIFASFSRPPGRHGMASGLQRSRARTVGVYSRS